MAVSTASTTPSIARLIGQSGGKVDSLFRTHSQSYDLIEQHLQTIVNNSLNPASVLTAAQAIKRVVGVPAEVSDHADAIAEEASGAASAYNSTRVLAHVARINAYMAQQNVTILDWLSTLNSSV